MTMASNDGKGVGIKGIVTAVFAGIFLLVTIAHLIYAWNRDSDAVAQKRMQENYQNWQANNPMPGFAQIPQPPPEDPRQIQEAKEAEACGRKFVEEVRAGNLQAAYAMTSSSHRNLVRFDKFEKELRYLSNLSEEKCNILLKFLPFRFGTTGAYVGQPDKGKTWVHVSIDRNNQWAWEVVDIYVPGVDLNRVTGPTAEEQLKDGEVFIALFLKDIRGDNLSAAYGKLTTDHQAKLSAEAFEELVRQHPGIKDIDQCHVRGNIRTPDASASRPVAGPKDAALAKTVVDISVKKQTFWGVDGFEVKNR